MCLPIMINLTLVEILSKGFIYVLSDQIRKYFVAHTLKINWFFCVEIRNLFGFNQFKDVQVQTGIFVTFLSNHQLAEQNGNGKQNTKIDDGLTIVYQPQKVICK